MFFEKFITTPKEIESPFFFDSILKIINQKFFFWEENNAETTYVY